MNSGDDGENDSILHEGIKLLQDMKIQDYNQWRMKNITIRPDLRDQDFSGKDLSRAYLNGASCLRTNLSHCNLTKVNFVQSVLNTANFERANLTDAILMYSEMEECNLINADLTRANFMNANLQNSNLTNGKMSKTNFVQANLRNAKLPNVDRSAVYLKYSKLEGTAWK